MTVDYIDEDPDPDDWDGYMRAFVLRRDDDESGVSGTGIVAEGIATSEGTVVMRWFNDANSDLETNTDGLSIKPAPDGIAATREIHGHGGRTKLVWADEKSAHAVARSMSNTLEDSLRDIEQSIIATASESL